MAKTILPLCPVCQKRKIKTGLITCGFCTVDFKRTAISRLATGRAKRHSQIPQTPDQIPQTPDQIPQTPDQIPQIPDQIPQIPESTETLYTQLNNQVNILSKEMDELKTTIQSLQRIQKWLDDRVCELFKDNEQIKTMIGSLLLGNPGVPAAGYINH